MQLPDEELAGSVKGRESLSKMLGDSRKDVSGSQILLFLLFFSDLLYPLQLLVLRSSQAALQATPTWESNRERGWNPMGTSQNVEVRVLGTQPRARGCAGTWRSKGGVFIQFRLEERKIPQCCCLGWFGGISLSEHHPAAPWQPPARIPDVLLIQLSPACLCCLPGVPQRCDSLA